MCGNTRAHQSREWTTARTPPRPPNPRRLTRAPAPQMSGMLKASAIVTKVGACVKESLQPKMAHEGKMYYTVIKYAEGAKETSRESFGVKE
ncbi:hypothetical protein SO694_00076196 [Aureococcus anophagefferens]|uniref:Cystatin domain-containing protein n=1 Tax=Aureococcus anophagefferens TaxID=44056 RepID=A0ABR1FHW6_AURAN